MQKLIYPIWKADDISAEAFRSTLLKTLSPKLISLGTLKLRICVADEDVAAAASYIITSDDDPIDGLVSIWVNSYLYRSKIEREIAAHVGRYSGYSVWESEPLANKDHATPIGHRTPGMSEIVLLRKPDQLDHSDWLDLWHNYHTPVAIETQSTFGYRQNVVIQSLTPDALHQDAIIEENFPAPAIHSRMAFYDAGDDNDLYRERERKMIDSCTRFIDFKKMDCIPMSEYIMQA